MPAEEASESEPKAPTPPKSPEAPAKSPAGSGPIPGFSGPRSFGRLTLLKAIARGGMGEVYLACAGGIEGAERPCVVKLIRTEHREDSSFLARFLDEARIQSQMQHPGVAQVLEAAIDPDGQPYVVVEHVAGRDLAEVRQRALRLKLQLSWADAVAVCVSVADALAHVHERTDAEGRPLHVAHRDLSPQNIMVSYGGDMKLIDFGTARGENRRCQTINGVVFAKPGYVAPEVAANNPGGAPADLYALGIVLWELIAGRRFLQGDAQEHLAAVAQGKRPPPALSLWLSIPKEVDAIIAKLTAQDLTERFSSAREACTRLQRALDQAPSLANGERSVRSRVAHLMSRLYPAEPARSRAEFAHLLGRAQSGASAGLQWPQSPHPADVAEQDKLLPGTRYHVEREIAQGPMSAVYEALHVDLGRKVALKVLDRRRCKNRQGEAEFREEARIVARLHHENIVQIHDFGLTGDGRPYYAMEYLDGETVAQLLEREGRLLWPEVLDIGIQACLALEAAHKRGIVHRDIKPENLLLTQRGTLKVLDFGITGSQQPVEDNAQGPLVLAGTPEYMAPEQVASADVDGRADVFALGTVLFELLTGKLPFCAESTVELLDRKMRTHATSPSRTVRGLGLPRYLDKVICTALNSRPENRYEDAQSLRLDLEWILKKGRRDTAPRRGLAWATGGLAAAAAAAVALSTALPPQITEFLPSQALGALRSFTNHAERLITSSLSFAGDEPQVRVEALSQPITPKGSTATPREVETEVYSRYSSIQTPWTNAQLSSTLETSMASVQASGSTKQAVVQAEGGQPDRASDIPPPADHHSPDNGTPDSALPAPLAQPASPAPTGSEDARPAEASPQQFLSPEPTAAPGRSPAPSAEPEGQHRPPPLNEIERRRQRDDREQLRHELARAATMIEFQTMPYFVRALGLYRQLGEQFPADPEVLSGWSQIAAKTKGWGESLKVAKRWAQVDPSEQALLHLARTQQLVGERQGAVESLRSWLKENGNADTGKQARTMLQQLGGEAMAFND